MSQPRHDPDLNAVERALAGLAPSAAALDRDALMFAAGRASAPRGRGWPCAAGSALAAAVLAALLLFRPAPDPVVRYVTVTAPPRETVPAPRPPDDSLAPDEAPPAPPASSPGRQADYLTLRHEAESWGDAGPPGTPLPAATARLAAPDDRLDLPPGVRADPWLQRRTTLLNPGGPL